MLHHHSDQIRFRRFVLNPPRGLLLGFRNLNIWSAGDGGAVPNPLL